MTDRAVALVESPAQLLNVMEWAYSDATTRQQTPVPAGGLDTPIGQAADFGSGVTIMILAPLQPVARLQLERMSDLARACGFAVTWREVRGEAALGVRGLKSLLAEIGSVPTLVVGDPFSGYLQSVIGLSRAGRLVVVDDGTATLEFVQIMNSARPLVRWHQREHASRLGRRIAGLARQRMMVGRRPWNARQPLQVFTAMPVDPPNSLDVRRHDYAWVRHRFAAPRVLKGADMVGTSLVESGVVDEDHYLTAVRTLTATHAVGRYLAHRRESAAKLAKISALGLTVVRPDLPLEVFARIGPVGEQVISFPSTMVHTLPLALSDVPVEVLVCDIEQQWFSPAHATSRGFLTSVTASARQLHGLNAVAA
jgi:hypothetical protein